MPTLFYISYVAMWVLLLLLGILVLLLYRHFGLVALGTVEGVQRDGLPVGEKAPAISGVTAQGETIGWAPKSGRSHLLAFVAPNCGPCARILPFINQLAAMNSHVEIALIVSGTRDSAIELVNKFHPPSSAICIAEDASNAHERYRVRVTPFAFMIGEDGRILAKGLCDNTTRLQQLLVAGGQGFPKFPEVVASPSRAGSENP